MMSGSTRLFARMATALLAGTGLPALDRIPAQPPRGGDDSAQTVPAP